MRTNLMRSRTRVGACVLGVAAALLLAACGGGEGGSLDPVAAPPPPPASELARQQAALAKAHALNADAMGQVKAERAAQRNKTQR
jgi:hypothetical protein